MTDNIRVEQRTFVSLAPIALLMAMFHFAPFFPSFVAAALGIAPRPFLRDFQTFFVAATNYRLGANPYALSITDPPLNPFLYPPTTLPIFLPLTWFGLDVSLLVFELVSVACLAYVFLAILKTAEEDIWPSSWRLVAIVALTAFYGISQTLQYGQVNLVATAGLTYAWRCARAGQRHEFGCAMGLFIATLLKTYPALLLLAFVIRREWKVVGWFSLLVAADAAITLATVPTDVWRVYLGEVVPSGRFGITPRGLPAETLVWSQSLNGALVKLVGDAVTMKIGFAVQLAVLAIAIVALLRRRHDNRRQFYDFSIGILMVVAFLITPLAWSHHYVFLIPALACFASLLNDERLRRKAWSVVLLLATIAIAVKWPELYAHDRPTRLVMTLPIIGPFALLVMFMVWSLRAGPPTTNRPGN